MATKAHWPLSPNRSLNKLSDVRGQDQFGRGIPPFPCPPRLTSRGLPYLFSLRCMPLGDHTESFSSCAARVPVPGKPGRLKCPRSHDLGTMKGKDKARSKH